MNDNNIEIINDSIIRIDKTYHRLSDISTITITEKIESQIVYKNECSSNTQSEYIVKEKLKDKGINYHNFSSVDSGSVYIVTYYTNKFYLTIWFYINTNAIPTTEYDSYEEAEKTVIDIMSRNTDKTTEIL